MARLILLLAVLLLSACAGNDTEPGCPSPRPQVCTMEYNPTCATLNDGSRKEYSSPCNACADTAVASIDEGPCPE